MRGLSNFDQTSFYFYAGRDRSLDLKKRSSDIGMNQSHRGIL